MRFNQEFNDIGASAGPGEYEALSEVVRALLARAESDSAAIMLVRINSLSADI